MSESQSGNPQATKRPVNLQGETQQDPRLSFGEETLILSRRWGHETRVVAMRMLDENLPLVEIGQALGREAADVLNFAVRCAPKLRALEPDTSRVRVRKEGTNE
jgi:hypothetical protein